MNNLKTNKILCVLLVLANLFFINSGQGSKKQVIAENEYGMVVKSGTKNKKVVALTFDDGPHPRYTEDILNILDEYDIKATFFVLGKLAETYPDIIKRQWEEGHEIGNHTYSHIDAKNASKEKLLEEYKKTQDIIYSITKYEPKVFRPPYGSFDKKVIDMVEENSSMVVLWSANQDSKDWKNPEIEKIINNTLSNVENGDIILFHDYVYYDESHTVEALKQIIPELKSRGYEFVTLSELLKLSRN
ncbi:polysaccharide deacetylase family protein [Clostridium sp. Cult3]|uniref:polysaccharide deacetylase family protein n=1 Tax=Clostridium sp. Cult3 TaxID=2079004 RepID=UPI001F2031EA|nr:polysaccharide deacetylase family protein [Clostridium sp. Cult3]MCF6460061.1 chitooligosaccharide deacetylase [Clostridium sp. Cult3]